MAIREGTVAALAAVFDTVRAHLDERQRRLLLGAGAQVLGHGEIRVVARAAGAREGTVARGLRELESAEALPGRVLGLVEPEERVDFLDATIAALTEQIDARTEPFQAAKQLLSSVPGFDRLVIDTVIAETGADMSRFPSPGHLAKWAGVCPGNHESAGKRRRVGITQAAIGCGAPLSKRPGPQPGQGVATSAHSTARSPSGAARTRPLSP